MPLVCFGPLSFAKTWMPPYSEPLAVVRRMFRLTLREPGLRSNVCGLARTYGDSDARRLAATAPVLRFCVQGRTVTVTRSVFGWCS